MANVNLAITQDMVNQYYLYLKTPKAKKENLYKLWEKELKQGLDLTQRKWIEDCIKGKRKQNIISRHNRHFVSQQQMMRPHNEYSKGFVHTLDELPKDDYSNIQKSLRG